MSENNEKRMTAKQAHFVNLYANDVNGEQAAIGAGYSKATARSMASRLLTRVYIKKAVQEQRDCKARRAGTSVEKVIRELARIGFSDPRQFFDDKGKLRPTTEWSSDMAAAVSSIEAYTPAKGKQKIIKLRFWPKNNALEKIGNHLGMFVEQHNVNVKVEKIERVIIDALPVAES